VEASAGAAGANGGAAGSNGGAAGANGGAAGVNGGAAGLSMGGVDASDATSMFIDARADGAALAETGADASPDAASCSGGVLCTPSAGADPCGIFVTDCSTGAASCVRIGNQLAGASCGVNQICTSAAACVACQPGADCTPGSTPCKQGTESCGGGQPVCNATATDRPDGASCGVNRVCHGGTCGDCTVNEACVPAQGACVQGRTSCSTGLSVCEAVGLMPAGTACGTNRVCDPTGACIDCQGGLSCTPANPCHVGSLSCATGTPACVDTSTPLPNNVFCAPDQLCSAGSCVSAGHWISLGEDNRSLTGGWIYTFQSAGATINPLTDSTTAFVPSPGGRTGKALAVSGVMPTDVPAQGIYPTAALGMTFTAIRAPIDAAARGTGIQFYASTSSSTSLSLVVVATDVRTDPEFPICSTSTSPTVVDRCYNNPAATCVVPPNNNWSLCRLFWSDFVRGDFGSAGTGLPVDAHAITAIDFRPPSTRVGNPSTPFQFAIDDISFVP
jgi:hypothetical protein